MTEVEFLPDDGGPPDDAPERDPRSRRRLAVRGLTVIALLAAAAVAVVVTNGSKPIPHSQPAASRPASPTVSAPPSGPTSALTLPVSIAFGPASDDVLAVGDRVYSLTPTLIAMAGRRGGAAVVRSVPFGLSAPVGRGELVADLDHRLLWIVDIGGNALGAYSLDNLEPLSAPVSPYPIKDAVAMDEQLWFTTNHGLYTAVAGPGAPRLVPRTPHDVGVIAADRALHTVLVVERTSPARLIAVSTRGPMTDVRLPISGVSSMVNLAGKLWLSGRSAPGPQLLMLSRAPLRPGPSTVITGVGNRPKIVGTFQNLLLVRADPGGRSLYCLDGHSGAIKQIWDLPLGAVSLNQTGLLVDAASGIQQLDARACLAG